MAPVLLNPSRFGGGGGPTTWDFRGLSALPAGWARRGVASETFDATGMTATYAAGQQHYYTLPAPVTSGLLEAKIVSAPVSGTMIGPTVYNPGGSFGVGTCYFVVGPTGALLIVVASNHQYNGTFINAGGTPGAPVWFRVRFAANVYYVSRSTDGTTWSAETSSAGGTTPVSEISIGSAYGSAAAATFEYVKWTTP